MNAHKQSEEYIQAKLMVIHTIGSQNANFAGALAPNFEHSEKLLPIVYTNIVYYKERELACKGECAEA